MGPVYLHRMLAAGASFMAELAAGTGRQAAFLGRLAAGAAPTTSLVAGGLQRGGGMPGERLVAAAAVPVASLGDLGPAAGPPPGGGTSMARVARRIDDSVGNARPTMPD
jgi:hypothetical protein